MYFIAYFLQPKKHHVIPYKWVSGINYESIINNGINRNIKFRAFYTNNQDAFDEHGIPRPNYDPDANARGQIFPNDGWYFCQIRKFKVNHTQAIAYCKRRRNIAPAVYNSSKLREPKRRHRRHRHNRTSPGREARAVDNTSDNISGK